MENLKPCPFCGGEAQYRDNGQWEKIYGDNGAIIDVDVSDPSVFIVECSCGAQIVSDESEGEVRTVWNNRHSSWNLLMEWLDEIYPADIFDGSSGDIGPQILVKLREINELRKIADSK